MRLPAKLHHVVWADGKAKDPTKTDSWPWDLWLYPCLSYDSSLSIKIQNDVHSMSFPFVEMLDFSFVFLRSLLRRAVGIFPLHHMEKIEDAHGQDACGALLSPK